MSKMGNPDGGMIPAVQGSDINDGWIIENTRTIPVGNGHYKFEITLPSGAPLSTEPVSIDYPKNQAVMGWCDAVRQALVNESVDANEEAMHLAREAQMAKSKLILPEGYAPQPEGLDNTPYQYIPPATPMPSDPVSYAKAMLAQAQMKLVQLTEAEMEVEKWQRVLASLGEAPVKKKKRAKKRVKKKSVHDGRGMG